MAELPRCVRSSLAPMGARSIKKEKFLCFSLAFSENRAQTVRIEDPGQHQEGSGSSGLVGSPLLGELPDRIGHHAYSAGAGRRLTDCGKEANIWHGGYSPLQRSQ